MRCQLAIAWLLCVARFVFPTFSVSKVVYHEYLFAICYVSHVAVSGTHLWDARTLLS